MTDGKRGKKPKRKPSAAATAEPAPAPAHKAASMSGASPGATAGAMGRRNKAGQLSEADQALWRRVTESARPLSGRKPAAVPEGKAAEAPARPARASRPLDPRARAEPVPLQPKQPKPPDLATGSIVGVARSQADRLRRGRLPIEARLDLHGYSQEKAHRALDAFLARAQERGKRCVLVVTGKGLGKGPGKDEGAGVLRRMVPLWLNQPPNRERVLAFDQAQPKDGGLGALYVLLKRRRSS